MRPMMKASQHYTTPSALATMTLSSSSSSLVLMSTLQTVTDGKLSELFCIMIVNAYGSKVCLPRMLHVYNQNFLQN